MIEIEDVSSQAEANKELMRRFYHEILEQGNLAGADALVSSSFVDHIPQAIAFQPVSGPDAVRSLVGMIRTAFPDLRVSVDYMMASKDTVMSRVTWGGTHSGRFMGMDPTGRRIKVMGFDMIRVADGKIVEHWGQIDVITILGQLGFLPDLW